MPINSEQSASCDFEYSGYGSLPSEILCSGLRRALSKFQLIGVYIYHHVVYDCW